MTASSYVEVFELKTGKTIERMGPMSDSKAEICLRGLLRQINDKEYGAAIARATQGAAPAKDEK